MTLDTVLKRITAHMKRLDKDFDFNHAEILDCLDAGNVGPSEYEEDFDKSDLEIFKHEIEYWWKRELRDREFEVAYAAG